VNSRRGNVVLHFASRRIIAKVNYRIELLVHYVKSWPSMWPPLTCNLVLHRIYGRFPIVHQSEIRPSTYWPCRHQRRFISKRLRETKLNCARARVAESSERHKTLIHLSYICSREGESKKQRERERERERERAQRERERFPGNKNDSRFSQPRRASPGERQGNSLILSLAFTRPRLVTLSYHEPHARRTGGDGQRGEVPALCPPEGDDHFFYSTL